MAKQAAGTTGQQGKARGRTYDQLNADQKAVLDRLRTVGAELKIRMIVELNGWDNPCKVKGNSRVRNAMRVLVREGFVAHGKEIGDGLYRATGSYGDPTPNPVALSRDEAEDLAEDLDLAASVKKTDCSFYNACLDQAISGKWQGFSCTSCSAYSEPSAFQKECDQVRLAAVQKAAELVEKYGKVHRVRGVKPGADAKRTHRLKVVETVSLSEALAGID